MQSIPCSIGPYCYSLVISDREIYDENNDLLDGCVIGTRRLLVVSKSVELDRREEVARHECVEAWLQHVPRPRDKEDLAQFVSMVGTQFDRDIEAAGGIEVLRRLAPTQLPNLGRPLPEKAATLPPENAIGSTDRLTCGACGSETLCGSIAHEDPQPDASGRFRVLRWFRCDQCAGLQTWWQYCRSTGELLGEYVSIPAPRMLRGEEAARWLAEHAMQTA